jgi:hypothetical protein
VTLDSLAAETEGFGVTIADLAIASRIVSEEIAKFKFWPFWPSR